MRQARAMSRKLVELEQATEMALEKRLQERDGTIRKEATLRFCCEMFLPPNSVNTLWGSDVHSETWCLNCGADTGLAQSKRKFSYESILWNPQCPFQLLKGA